MNVYLAMSRACAEEARVIQDRIAAAGMRPISTWPMEEAPIGPRSARVIIDNSDRQLAQAATLLVVLTPDTTTIEVGVLVGQAIELHMPVVWCGPPSRTAYRPGFRMVESIDAGLELLASWAKKLRGGIADEFAKRALWVMLQSEEAREADRLGA